MKLLSKRQKRTKDIDVEKINGKREEIIIQKATHNTKNGDIMNPKREERICMHLKISVMSVVCMIIGLIFVTRQNILQIYIKSL
jgi:hypothetical protein